MADSGELRTPEPVSPEPGFPVIHAVSSGATEHPEEEGPSLTLLQDTLATEDVNKVADKEQEEEKTDISRVQEENHENVDDEVRKGGSLPETLEGERDEKEEEVKGGNVEKGEEVKKGIDPTVDNVNEEREGEEINENEMEGGGERMEQEEERDHDLEDLESDAPSLKVNKTIFETFIF